MLQAQENQLRLLNVRHHKAIIGILILLLSDTCICTCTQAEINSIHDLDVNNTICDMVLCNSYNTLYCDYMF